MISILIADWKMVFKVSSGSNKPAYGLWMDSAYNTTLDQCNQDITKKCSDNFKDSSVEEWTDVSVVRSVFISTKCSAVQ